MIREMWIAETMGITERPDPRTNIIRPIDMTKECDLAYLRVRYKRAMYKNKAEELKGEQ